MEEKNRGIWKRDDMQMVIKVWISKECHVNKLNGETKDESEIQELILSKQWGEKNN